MKRHLGNSHYIWTFIYKNWPGTEPVTRFLHIFLIIIYLIKYRISWPSFIVQLYLLVDYLWENVFWRIHFEQLILSQNLILLLHYEGSSQEEKVKKLENIWLSNPGFNELILSVLEKLKNNFLDSNNSTNFKHQWLEYHKCKVWQPGYH